MRARALVLAAGFGTRLAPLTLGLPKPLLPVVGTSVLRRTLRSLAQAGCESATVNLHHLGQRIQQRIGDSCDGMPIRYSSEERVLGTLGGVVRQWSHLRNSDQVVVVNGDSLCEWPWRRLLKRHRRSDASVSLLVHRTLDASHYGGGVGLDEKNMVVRLRGLPIEAEPRQFRVFLGAQVLSGKIFQRLDKLADGPADLVGDLYLPLLLDGWRLHAVSTRRRWQDLGTPERYLSGCHDRIRGLRPNLLWRRSWISPQAHVDPSARISRSIVEAGVSVGARAIVDRSLVMPSANIGPECRLTGCVVGPHTSLPAATTVFARMVTNAQASYQPTQNESVISGLVFSPLSQAGTSA